MGHTNYWITKTYKEIGDPDYELEFAFRARDVLNEIIKSGIVLTDESGEKIFENAEQIIPNPSFNTICFNGLANESYDLDQSCEPFKFTLDGTKKFCKTNNKPYDIAVKSLLILAKENGILKEFSFDGLENNPNYLKALEFCELL